MRLVLFRAQCRIVRGGLRGERLSDRAEVPMELDPLRYGAGEAGTFHPLAILRKQYELTAITASFYLRSGGGGNGS